VHTPKLQIIRRASFTATPWKNGGGITHEAIRVPPTGDPFRWRVSVAHIDVSGPFSEFAEYNRKMVLLQGAGLDLRFGDGTHKSLRKIGELVEFDGALAAHCELLKGPCVDFNLMTAKSDGVAARVERFMESLVVSAGRNETLVQAGNHRGKNRDARTVGSCGAVAWQRPPPPARDGQRFRIDLGVSGDATICEWRVAGWFRCCALQSSSRTTPIR